MWPFFYSSSLNLDIWADKNTETSKLLSPKRLLFLTRLAADGECLYLAEIIAFVTFTWRLNKQQLSPGKSTFPPLSSPTLPFGRNFSELSPGSGRFHFVFLVKLSIVWVLVTYVWTLQGRFRRKMCQIDPPAAVDNGDEGKRANKHRHSPDRCSSCLTKEKPFLHADQLERSSTQLLS